METVTKSPAENNRATNTSGIDDRLRDQIKQTLKEVGVPISQEEGLGPAIEQPVLEKATAKAAGAVNVGHEEHSFEYEERDARNLFKILRSYFTGESIWGRLGAKGRKWIGILKKRTNQETLVKKETRTH